MEWIAPTGGLAQVFVKIFRFNQRGRASENVERIQNGVNETGVYEKERTYNVVRKSSSEYWRVIVCVFLLDYIHATSKELSGICCKLVESP